MGECLRVRHGFAFRGEFFSSEPTGRVILTPGNFYEKGGFRRTRGKEKYYTADPPPEFVLKPSDLVVAMTEQAPGLLGSSALIPEGDEYLHNQRIGLVEVREPDKLDRLFAYYLFNTSAVRSQIQATATGAKVRHTAPSRIEAIEVTLPPVGVQRRIGSLLMTYDRLIENNMRRMRILEEVAQAIYREWFVEFRFPGHEDVPLVESELGPIPEGWRVGRLSESLPFALAKPRVANYEGSKTYLATADCEGVHSLSAGVQVAFDALPSRAQHQPVPDSVWFGRMAGYQKVLLFPANSSEIDLYVLSSGFACIRCPDGWFAYIAAAVLVSGFEDQKSRFATGATQVTLTDRGAKQMPWLVPPNVTVAQFSTLVRPLLELLLSLRSKNGVLRATRDLLLPRLISGEVDVSGLDIDSPRLLA